MQGDYFAKFKYEYIVITVTELRKNVFLSALKFGKMCKNGVEKSGKMCHAVITT